MLCVYIVVFVCACVCSEQCGAFNKMIRQTTATKKWRHAGTSHWLRKTNSTKSCLRMERSTVQQRCVFVYGFVFALVGECFSGLNCICHSVSEAHWPLLVSRWTKPSGVMLFHPLCLSLINHLQLISTAIVTLCSHSVHAGPLLC